MMNQIEMYISESQKNMLTSLKKIKEENTIILTDSSSRCLVELCQISTDLQWIVIKLFKYFVTSLRLYCKQENEYQPIIDFTPEMLFQSKLRININKIEFSLSSKYLAVMGDSHLTFINADDLKVNNYQNKCNYLKNHVWIYEDKFLLQVDVNQFEILIVNPIQIYQKFNLIQPCFTQYLYYNQETKCLTIQNLSIQNNYNLYTTYFIKNQKMINQTKLIDYNRIKNQYSNFNFHFYLEKNITTYKIISKWKLKLIRKFEIINSDKEHFIKDSFLLIYSQQGKKKVQQNVIINLLNFDKIESKEDLQPKQLKNNFYFKNSNAIVSLLNKNDIKIVALE